MYMTMCYNAISHVCTCGLMALYNLYEHVYEYVFLYYPRNMMHKGLKNWLCSSVSCLSVCHAK